MIKVKVGKGIWGAEINRQNIDASPKLDLNKWPFNLFVANKYLFFIRRGAKSNKAIRLRKKISCAIPNSRPTPFMNAYITAKPSAARNAKRIAKVILRSA